MSRKRPRFVLLALALLPFAFWLGREAIRASAFSGVRFFAPGTLLFSTVVGMAVVLMCAVRSIQRDEPWKPLAAIISIFCGGSILFSGLLALMGK